jgi:hypothetical protein
MKCSVGSDANIRSHLGKVHKLINYMYESQRTPSIDVAKNDQIDKKTAKRLNEAILECIIEDSRPFGDFHKSGMRKFLGL